MADPAARKVLVTGGAGFIGAPLVRELLTRGFAVVALDDFSVGSRGRLEGLGGELSVVEADLRDAGAVEDAVAGVEPWGVVHLAALHFIPDCVARPEETLARNVRGTQHLLDALAASPPARLLFASTADVYAPSPEPHDENDAAGPINVYGASKLEGENLVRSFAAASPTSLRLFNTYGAGDTNPHVLPEIVGQMQAGDALRLGNVDARRDYVLVDDVVRVIVELLDREGGPGTVNVGSGDTHSVRELVETLGRLTGRPLEIEIDESRLRPVDRPVLAARTDRLRELLPDLRPVGIEDGLRRLLEVEGLL